MTRPNAKRLNTRIPSLEPVADDGHQLINHCVEGPGSDWIFQDRIAEARKILTAEEDGPPKNEEIQGPSPSGRVSL